jgi:prephenate dehydrogenase
MSAAPRAHIIGLGLIGGSIGIALRRSGWRVSYVDPAVSLADAKRVAAADDEGARATDLTIIATPADLAVRLVSECAGAATSVCSVMQPLRDAARGDFVAGHPLAGSAERGLGAASGDLFRGKRWFVDADHELVDRVIADCGAIRERVDASAHDAAVALTSHLPQILSTALAAHLQRSGVEVRFAGTGLRTFLRLAQSDASVWAPIIAANRYAIEKHGEQLMGIASAILDGDVSAFRDANEFMKRLAHND